jgi:ribonuclease-3
MALTHRSYAFEQGETETNERLEFLGDSVLGLVVTDLAYRRFGELPEGELAKLRAAIVNMGTLALVAGELGLGQELRLGKGEELSGGRGKASILADALEALFGAVYLDMGMEADHEKEFTATVFVAGTELGRGRGRSKKEAEQRAARQAFGRLSGSEEELAKEG